MERDADISCVWEILDTVNDGVCVRHVTEACCDSDGDELELRENDVERDSVGGSGDKVRVGDTS